MPALSNIMAAKGSGRIANATRSRAEANAIHRRARFGIYEDRFDEAVADGTIEGWNRRGGLYDIVLPNGVALTFDPAASWAALGIADALNVDAAVIELLTA